MADKETRQPLFDGELRVGPKEKGLMWTEFFFQGKKRGPWLKTSKKRQWGYFDLADNYGAETFDKGKVSWIAMHEKLKTWKMPYEEWIDSCLKRIKEAAFVIQWTASSRSLSRAKKPEKLLACKSSLEQLWVFASQNGLDRPLLAVDYAASLVKLGQAERAKSLARPVLATVMETAKGRRRVEQVKRLTAGLVPTGFWDEPEI